MSMGIRYLGKLFLKKLKLLKKNLSVGLMRARTLFFNDQNRLVLLPFIRAGLPINRGQV